MPVCDGLKWEGSEWTINGAGTARVCVSVNGWMSAEDLECLQMQIGGGVPSSCSAWTMAARRSAGDWRRGQAPAEEREEGKGWMRLEAGGLRGCRGPTRGSPERPPRPVRPRTIPPYLPTHLLRLGVATPPPFPTGRGVRPRPPPLFGGGTEVQPSSRRGASSPKKNPSH